MDPLAIVLRWQPVIHQVMRLVDDRSPEQVEAVIAAYEKMTQRPRKSATESGACKIKNDSVDGISVSR